MSKYETPAEVAEFFALRDTIADLLKVAGVKKHSRHAVAEVLLDAGVIDLDAFDVVEQEGEEKPHEWAVDDRAVWSSVHGRIVAVEEGGILGFLADDRQTVRSVPVDWVRPE